MRVLMLVCAACVSTSMFGSFARAEEPKHEGVLIKTVVANSAAAKIGLRSGDRIMTIDDQPVEDAFSMAVAISVHQPGTPLRLSVLRTDKLIALEQTFGQPNAVAATPGHVRTAAPVYYPTPPVGTTGRPIGD